MPTSIGNGIANYHEAINSGYTCAHLDKMIICYHHYEVVKVELLGVDANGVQFN